MGAITILRDLKRDVNFFVRTEIFFALAFCSVFDRAQTFCFFCLVLLKRNEISSGKQYQPSIQLWNIAVRHVRVPSH